MWRQPGGMNTKVEPHFVIKYKKFRYEYKLQAITGESAFVNFVQAYVGWRNWLIVGEILRMFQHIQQMEHNLSTKTMVHGWDFHKENKLGRNSFLNQKKTRKYLETFFRKGFRFVCLFMDWLGSWERQNREYSLALSVLNIRLGIRIKMWRWTFLTNRSINFLFQHSSQRTKMWETRPCA